MFIFDDGCCVYNVCRLIRITVFIVNTEHSKSKYNWKLDIASVQILILWRGYICSLRLDIFPLNIQHRSHFDRLYFKRYFKFLLNQKMTHKNKTFCDSYCACLDFFFFAPVTLLTLLFCCICCFLFCCSIYLKIWIHKWIVENNPEKNIKYSSFFKSDVMAIIEIFPIWK